MRLWFLLLIPFGLLLSLSEPDRGLRKPVTAAQAAPFASAIDGHLSAGWGEAGLRPAPEVDALTLMRRLWLDLLGTTPSLSEVRALEQVSADQAQAWLIERALSDERFDAVLAERLARIAVGGQDAKQDDLTYRRRRLVSWLTGQVRRDRPWDSLVRELVSADGLSTDTPAVNFTISQDGDPTKLAARTTRAFLGVRIDCAQCHDHPFARWKQRDFEGLAAFYARLRRDLTGVREAKDGELLYQLPAGVAAAPQDADHAAITSSALPLSSLSSPSSRLEIKAPFGQPVLIPPGQSPPEGVETRSVAPAVPFAPELLPERASRREALALWLTDARNPYFAQALVNRFWSWLIGRGLVEPVDELDTTRPSDPRLLELLAERFRESGFDLRLLVRAIVSSQAYRLDSALAPGAAESAESAESAHAESAHAESAESDESARASDAYDAYALRALKPLRGDQLAAAILQAGSLRPFDHRRAPLLRFANWAQRNDFTRRHGDDLAQEEAQDETLLQRLHLLNGKTLREVTKHDDIFGPVTRVPLLAPSDPAAVEVAFLITLTRRPSEEESQRFSARLSAAPRAERDRVMSDLLWTLLNSTEFAWCR